MTQNQLTYLRYMEDMRANKARENIDSLKAISDVEKTKVSQRQQDLAEAKEYNRPYEATLGPLKFKWETRGSREKLDDARDLRYLNNSLDQYVSAALKGGFVYGK